MPPTDGRYCYFPEKIFRLSFCVYRIAAAIFAASASEQAFYDG